ncbi:MAG: 2Fe-2S iron-sulfur cluster-binding protein, partial [Actinomycetota bacterium]
MPKSKIKIDVEPIGKKLYLKEPANGLDAIRGGGIGIKSVCGGKGTCGKCRIILLNDKEAPLSRQEEKILTADEVKKGVRLACQQTFDRDLDIYIPASSLSEEQKLQVVGTERDIKADPVCKKYYVELERATLEDLTPDFERIRQGLKSRCRVEDIDFSLLGQLPETIRKGDWKVTVTVRGSEVVNIEPGDESGKNYGIAVDLGTTKIAILLVDLKEGRTLDSKGIMNPQISYGEDVMSRLNFAMSGQDNLIKIQEEVTGSINEGIGYICKKNKIGRQQVSEVTVVGNTAMHHLFLGLGVRQLSLSPFVSVVGHSLNIKARELGIDISRGGYVYMLPPIAGFVGSDH